VVDKIEVDNWADLPEEDDIYHDLPTQPMIVIPPTPILDKDMDNNESVDTKATKLEEAILGLNSIDRRNRSTCNRVPTCLTKVSFDNKSYSDGQYKDGTIHITVDSGHNANHPSPIDPDPLMHVLGIAMLHYTNPEARAVAFAQSYSFKAGLKKFGKVGKTAAVTKLTQLHTYETYHPVHTKLLSPAEQKQALLSLLNIVEKRDGRVRARAVTDSSKECTQPGYKKEDGASPTVATDSIMITATIDAHEQRDIATIDIPGAHSSMPTMTRRRLCSLKAASPSSWSKWTRNYTTKLLSTTKTIKHSYMLNYQRQYTVFSRALSFSTEGLLGTSKITKGHSQSTHTTHALPTLRSTESK
jgi:hypothetical protein